MPELDAGWPHGSQDPIGQAGEFLVWAALITQSGGGLHVFLPELDRGLDAVIHRLDDGAYLALQVKTKTYVNGPEAVIAVYEKHLFTPDQLVIGVHLDGDRRGPFVLVADAATFKRKAARMADRGRQMLVADMPIRPIPGHSWSEDLVPFDSLAERLGAKRCVPNLALELEPVLDEDRLIGSWGEDEVRRRLAFLEDSGRLRFGNDELRVLETLAAFTGIALDRVRLFQQEHEARLALERAAGAGRNALAVLDQVPGRLLRPRRRGLLRRQGGRRWRLWRLWRLPLGRLRRNAWHAGLRRLLRRQHRPFRRRHRRVRRRCPSLSPSTRLSLGRHARRSGGLPA